MSDQPKFMVYDIATDNLVPLTQDRLNQLTRIERAYGEVMCEIRNIHNIHASMRRDIGAARDEPKIGSKLRIKIPDEYKVIVE